MNGKHADFLVVIIVPNKHQFPHPPFSLREEDPLLFLCVFHVTAHHGDTSLCPWLIFISIMAVRKELVAP